MKKKIIPFALLLLMSSATVMAQHAARIDKYVDMGETWLSDRLQMHWNTHATRQYMNGESYDHCGGDSASVPTLQINGARSHATSCVRPTLEELQPRQEDPRGMWLQDKSLPNQAHEWVPISKTGNIVSSINHEIASLALEAARVWEKTGNERYARAAWRVLDTYLMGVLYTEMPTDMNHGHMQTLYGLQTQEVIHEESVPKLCQLYEILKGCTCLSEGEFKPDEYDAALKHWADIIEANGVPHNNWDLMQARFIFNIGQVLRPDSAYADHKGQEHYFDIVETGHSIRQWGLKILTDYGFDAGNGIWCECPGYCQVVLGDLAEFVRLYDTQLGRDLTAQLPIIVKAARTNIEYLYPDSMTIGFGDTHPARLNRAIYEKLGLDFSSLHPSRTFSAPRTSWLVQRTGMDRDRSLAFALNASDGNHMHANGIAMELFGRGQRLAPDAGIGYSLYSGDDYLEWYSRFPAHNTVCVDGISDYPVMKSSHPFEIVANTEMPVGRQGATAQYSLVRFMEPETQSPQERLVLMVSGSEDNGDGYFVDIFRSHRSDGHDRFHDYFYHGMGQEMRLRAADGAPLALEPTDELAFAGAHLYAYSYLFDKQAAVTSQDVRVDYSICSDSIRMLQWTKGEAGRMVVQCLAPTTEGLSRMAGMPYDIRRQPTLTFVARQYGEAWTRPFVSVFAPDSRALPTTVAQVSWPDVTILDRATTSAVAVLVRHTDGRQELIVSTDNDKARVRVLGKKYTGRLCVADLTR